MSEQNLNEQNVQPVEEDIDALRQVRLDKLADMQQSGNDPFVITKFDVTASTAECRAMNEAEELFGTGRMIEALNRDVNASPKETLQNV